MTPTDSLYDNPRVAAGYAYARPPVHPHILDRVRAHLHITTPVARALDVGCGAGRSTAALGGVARQVVGLDPAAAMLEHRRAVAPGARFLLGEAERLPFSGGAFDLITAAGSINYADLDLALPEVARVLAAAGTFVIYDFSAGRRLARDPRLDEWYVEFDRRFPDAPGYEVEVRRLPFDRAHLTLSAYEAFEVDVPMSLESYFRYVMSETRIELARSAGAAEGAVSEWCRRTLEKVFDDDEPKEVVFEAYVAYVQQQP